MPRRLHPVAAALSLGAALSVALAGCGATSPTASTTPSAAPLPTGPTTPTAADLDGRAFLATATSDARAVPEPRLMIVRFERERLYVTGGCNGTSGAFRLDGDQLGFDGDALQTMMGCIGGPSQAQDDWLDALLTPAAQVELRDAGRTLELRRGKRSATFGMLGPAGGPSPLAGPQWRADTLLTGTRTGTRAGSSEPIVGPMIRPAFRIQAGRATIFTGCNSATATAGVEDRTLVLGRWTQTTSRPCPGYLGRVDALARTALTGRVRFTYRGANVVQLTGPGGRGLAFISPPRPR